MVGIMYNIYFKLIQWIADKNSYTDTPPLCYVIGVTDYIFIYCVPINVDL